MNSTIEVYAESALGDYGFGDNHPFGNDRLGAFKREFIARGLDQLVALPPSRLATSEELLRFHTQDYLKRAQSLSKIGFGYLDLGDTPARLGIFDAAARVVGTALEAAESLMSSDTRRCFLPIGGLHHGRRDSAGGFCVLNDCGVVIETLKQQYGLDRIAYVDIDAHHGDGVFYEFEDDPSLLVADIHEDGRFLYPGTGMSEETGRGRALGLKLNIPMLPESDEAAFLNEWPRVLEHVAQFSPEFIMLQAGADSVVGDPLTHLEFTPACHRHACRTLCDLADSLSSPLMIMGGGGYNLHNIAQTWCGIVEELLIDL
ncbi:MAG: acetoin utilization protein AcuC [marine bacterium B5-7]|nr:MAG: acetoin utilization protein AcuC [marine bacterium B5-7]